MRDRLSFIVDGQLRALRVGILLIGTMGVLPAHSGGRVLTTSDIVVIKIVNHPELDATTRIEPGGTINFPFAGRIKAAGLTEDDLARSIETKLVERQILAEVGQRPSTSLAILMPFAQLLFARSTIYSLSITEAHTRRYGGRSRSSGKCSLGSPRAGTCARTIGLKIRISRHDGTSARCGASNRPDQFSGSPLAAARDS
jgi:Polysaccharide biosynthesis/export protein